MKIKQAVLASRIRNAKPMDGDGRYDMASKLEVKAYLAEEVEVTVQVQFEELTRRYEARIAELELSWWEKWKRAFSHDHRRVGKPREFAAPYGKKTGKGPSEVV